MSRLRAFWRGKWRRRLALESGQAAVEYTTIAWALLAGMFFFGRPMLIGLMQALQVYFDSFYTLLRLPIP
jgi:hypothetical protein